MAYLFRYARSSAIAIHLRSRITVVVMVWILNIVIAWKLEHTNNTRGILAMHWLPPPTLLCRNNQLCHTETAPNCDVAITFWFGVVETAPNCDVANTFWFGVVETAPNCDVVITFWFGVVETAPNYDVAITFWFGVVEAAPNCDVAITFWFGVVETAPNCDVVITFWFGVVETAPNCDVAITFWFGVVWSHHKMTRISRRITGSRRLTKTWRRSYVVSLLEWSIL